MQINCHLSKLDIAYLLPDGRSAADEVAVAMWVAGGRTVRVVVTTSA
jgi:hypothetical protein